MKLINYIFPFLIITLSLSQHKLVDFDINKLVGWAALIILTEDSAIAPFICTLF